MKSRSFNVLVILALFLSLLGSAVSVTPARAASIVVNTNADNTTVDGLCTLREAITNANNNAATYPDCTAGLGADTITFAGDYTITLAGSQLPTVSSEITITGNGATKTIIRANAAPNTATYRVFEVSVGGDLTLEILTVQNGVCSNTCATNPIAGGGILNSGKLTVTDSAISNNSAGQGGGIFNNIGTLTVTNSTFSNNSATNGGGGGTTNFGTMTLTNSTFSGNTATLGGGGIANAGTLSLTNGTFSSNTAGTNGGGIVNSGGTATVTNSTLSGNSATTNGGGIANTGTVTLTKSTLSGNSANSWGGGIYNNGTLLVQNGSVIGGDTAGESNTAGDGGGIYNIGGTTTIDASTVSGNKATNDGGGIRNEGTLNVQNGSVIGGDTAGEANIANNGGGIYHIIGTATINNSTVSRNSASSNGGGIYNSAILTITNSTFNANSATIVGGLVNNGTATITNSTFNANSATIVGALINDGTATITNSTFNGNSASDSGGVGGIYNNLGGLNLLNTIIANSTNGDCIVGILGSIGIEKNNLITGFSHEACDIVDGTNGSITGSAANLDVLADNGGSTQTIALLAGSPGIDAGDAATCAASPVSGKDQRGVTRPQGAACDIGAYEAGAIIPIVTASNPSANAVLTSLSSITVVFNQDMLDNATADGAENVNNYILVERGANASFDTTSCNGGVVSDDVQQTISSASYSNAGFITTLTLASPLTNGTYRLFICGTTSIWSAAGLELNNGASDATVDFTIGAATATSTRTGKTDASSLPKTGFAPKKVTTLPAQPQNLAYANLGDLWLEIPSLNVKSTIVGVPQNADKSWDVSWLGNDTGWLNGTAFPTWNGNSVLTAHVTNASGLDGPFAALKSLRYGDQVIVHFGGVKYVYEVRETKLSRPYSTSYAFESKQDAAYLTLITCQGYNPLNESYLFRRLVRAILVEVK